MATAIATGMINKGGFLPAQISIVEHNANNREQLHHHLGVTCSESLSAIRGKPDVWILAVKPQNMQDALRELAPLLHQDQLVLSVAAGLTIATLTEWLNGHGKVVRTMPNTPALVGQGVTGIYAPLAMVTENEQVLINQIFTAVGVNVWLKTEKAIDAITAISGSGPAYVFYMMEHLTAAAHELGFDNESAQLLVQNTFAGAVALAGSSSDSVATLRERVTSKGGTTAAALAVFNERGVNEALIEGAKAATKRAVELSIELSK